MFSPQQAAFGFPGVTAALSHQHPPAAVRYGIPGIGPAMALTAPAVPALWNVTPSNYNTSYVIPYRGADLGALSSEFLRSFRFGIIDNALLVAMTLAGVSLEDKIAKAVGVKGYGALLGATIGNAISDGVAGLPEGKSAALGVTAGALLPALPIFAAMLMKKKIKGTTHKVLLASSVALLALAFLGKRMGSGASA